MENDPGNKSVNYSYSRIDNQKQVEKITERELQWAYQKRTKYTMFGRQCILKDKILDAAGFIQHIKVLVDEA